MLFVENLKRLSASLVAAAAATLWAGSAIAAGTQSCTAVSAETCAIAHSLKRGVNFGNMLDAPTEGAWGVSVLPAYIDVAGAAFNTVRLPVRWSNHAGPTVEGVLDETFARRVDYIVDTLLAKGVYVILDLHHYNQIVGDPLSPGEFGVNERILDARFVNIWRQIATRYKDRSPKLIFELMNEPRNRLTAEIWNALAAKTLAAVRVTNPKRTVMIDVTNFGRADAYDRLVMPNDKNVMMAAHSYEPTTFTIQYNTKAALVTCCDSTQKAVITAALDKMKGWNQRTGVPVHLGEFGSYERAPIASREIYTRFVRDEAEARGFGWAYWEFASSFGVYPAASNTWLEPLRRALLDD